MSKIYTRSAYILLSVTTILLSWGCNIINPAEKIPTYIHIDSFQFEGTQSHDIKCAWVYYNNNPIGAFDLPCTVPIITSGTTGELQIAPAILINGRNERPVAYPFYTIDVSTLETRPGEIVYRTPKTKYFDSVRFFTISDFEAGITKFAKWGGTTGIIAVTADSLKFEGTGTGAVFLGSSADSSIDSTSTGFTIPSGASFIEFDYKSSIPFAFGMQGFLTSSFSTNVEYLAGVSPNDKWQKFYLNTTGYVNNHVGGTYYLYLKTSMPSGQTNGRLLIDNIKLVTY
jgi:hypothetical protein